LLLRLFGAHTGRKVSIAGSVRIEMPWDLTLGENVTIGVRTHLYNLGGLSIGNSTSISQDVYICGGTHDYTTLAYPLIRKKITIGNYVWIAAGAFIGPGVTIGDGAVVGARAVVMKDVAPWTVVAGHPAKVIKPRTLRHALPEDASTTSTLVTPHFEMTDPNRPLRILHLLACSDAGGLSRYVYDLCLAMHAAGHEVAVAGSPGAWHWLFESAPWPWINVPMQGGLPGLWRSVHQLRTHLAKHPVDVIHSHYRRTTLVGRRLQSAENPPLLYTLHLSHISLNWPRNLFTDFGDHVHVASVDAARWLREAGRMPADRITTIPHGIDTGRFKVAGDEDKLAARNRLGLTRDATVAAYVGRFDDPKNEDWILDLAAATRGVLPDLRLLLVGEGPHENHLRQRIDRENLRDRVQLVPRCDPLSVYHAIDALLLPSTREGFSLVCAEAMSTGVPVLRTKTSGTSELILQNVTGRSVEIDHDAFIRASIEFLSNRDELRQMGAAAADHIRSHFTFDQQVQRTIELYRRLSIPSARR